MQTNETRQFGRYDLINEIARGGMAVVFRAYDPRFQREVAIKVLPAAMMFDNTFRERFEREARTFAALDHPAIVPVYDFGEQDGQPYLVMRLMRGGSLEERIQRRPMSLDEARRVFGRLASALELAHHKGVIHRDLKPSNILFDQYNDAFLSDFGISRLVDATLKLTTNFTIGTPGYMSPEQIQGRELDQRSDVYGLGVLFYEMLTGQALFQADTPAMLVVKQMTEPIPDLAAQRPDLPDQVIQATNRALARAREDRLDSAANFAIQIGAQLQMPGIDTMQAQASIPAEENAASDILVSTVKDDTAGLQMEGSGKEYEFGPPLNSDPLKTKKFDLKDAKDQEISKDDQDLFKTRKLDIDGEDSPATPAVSATKASQKAKQIGMSPAAQEEASKASRRRWLPWLTGVGIIAILVFLTWLFLLPPDPDSLTFDCISDPGIGQDYPLIEAPYTNSWMRIDGHLSTRFEWAQAWCGDFFLHEGLDQNNEHRILSRWWIQYNETEIYFLTRIPLEVETQAVFVNYFWPRYTGLWTHSDGVAIDVEWDVSDLTKWDETNWHLDEEMDPPGEWNVAGAVSEDEQYVWFEFKKELDSGDSYDWSLYPGIQIGWNPYDSLIFGAAAQDTGFLRHIQLLLLDPDQ